MHFTALILTGGDGNRMKNLGFPKQFFKLLGKPVFIHCLETYENINRIDDIYLVINGAYEDKYQEILSKYHFKKLKKVVKGGINRQDSVENGLLAINNTDMVVLQDGVNPTTHKETIEDCIETAKIYGASSAATPARHTITTVKDREVGLVLERSELVYICAPQVYKFEWIKEALKSARSKNLINRPTVELMRRMGYKVALVNSPYENVKLTTPKDIPSVEEILRQRNGYK